jgi:hypothetical protein
MSFGDLLINCPEAQIAALNAASFMPLGECGLGLPKAARTKSVVEAHGLHELSKRRKMAARMEK